MKLIESPLYNNNLERIVNKFTFSELLGKRVFVTGGLGLIGSSIVDLLLKINEHPEGKIDISVGGRNKEKLRKGCEKFFQQKESFSGIGAEYQRFYGASKHSILF